MCYISKNLSQIHYSLGAVLLLCGICSTTALQAQKKKLSSPYAALYAHFHYLKSDDYNPSKAILPFVNFKGKNSEKLDLAVKLKAIFDSEYLFLEENNWPKEVNYVDSTFNDHRYILHKNRPEIYLVKQSEDWVYSSKTIEVIPNLFERALPFGISKFMMWFPMAGKPFFMGMHLWQIVGIIIYFAFGFLMFFLLRWVTRNLLIRLLEINNVNENKRQLIKNIATPIILGLLFYFFGLLLPLLQLPITLFYKCIVFFVRILPIYFIAGAGLRLCNVLEVILVKQASKTESKMDDQLAPIIAKFFKVLVAVIAFVYTLFLFNINVIPLLAGLSLGGLAIALAAQDTLKNLFASVMIFLDKPFQIGDYIISEKITGTVESVGFRSSLIRTFSNSLQYVPNNILANSVIDNLGKRHQRCFRTSVSITYDTPTYKIDLFIQGIRKLIMLNEKTNKESFQVFLNELADSSLNIFINVHFLVLSWDQELACKHYLLKQILELAEALEVRMAYPTQSIHIENQPNLPSLTPIHQKKESVERKMLDWFKSL